MSTTLPPTERTAWTRWKDFWFAPTDPTALGFMRIVTGVILLYVHLTYSLDLQAFFGKYGWYGTDYATRERQEFPWNVPDFFAWDDKSSARLPEYPHRRAAVSNYIRSLPDDPAQRREALAFLTRIGDGRYPGNEVARQGLEYVLQLEDVDLVRETRLTTMVDERLHNNPVDQARIPAFMLALPREGENSRTTVAAEIRAFWKSLPKDNPYERQYVLNHLIEMDWPARQAFVKFLNELPSDPAERRRVFDYLEYWNNDPRHVHRQGHSVFSIWFHVTDPAGMAAAHAVGLFIILLFTVGFCTRVTSVLTWLVAVGYIHRSQQVLFGMDTMSNILLLYLMIGNSGAALSIDRLIARYRAARASIRRTGGIDVATRAFLDGPPPSASAGFAVRLIQIHLCFIYLAAGLAKLKGNAWWNTLAAWDVTVSPEFTLLRYRWYEGMLRALIEYKPVFYFGCAANVLYTFVVEIGFPFLVWTRLRPYYIALAMVMHAGIGVLMGLNLFQLLMMVLLLSYIPSWVVRERFRRPGGLRLGYRFDGRAAVQARGAAAVLAVDIENQVTAEAAEGVKTPALSAQNLTPATGSDAVRRLFSGLRLLRWFRPVLLVPGVAGLLAKLMFPEAGGGKPPNGSSRLPGAAPVVAR